MPAHLQTIDLARDAAAWGGLTGAIEKAGILGGGISFWDLGITLPSYHGTPQRPYFTSLAQRLVFSKSGAV